MNDLIHRLEVADQILSKNLAWISAADGKIPPVFAINTAMLGVVAVLLPSSDKWTVFNAIASAITGMLLFGSLIFLALAAFPRLTGPKGSAVYFGGATTQSEEKYLTRITVGATEDLIEDTARQAYRNAEIASAKYAAIKHSMILLFASIPFWLITVSILYVM